MGVPSLVAPDGTPLRAVAPGLGRRAEHFRAIQPAFRGADPISQELGGWHPSLTSPAGETWGERDPLVARIQDITRNNGFAAGAQQTLVDSVIGAKWRLSARPNWRSLGIDFKAARAWATMVAAKWRSYAEDPGCWIDAERRQRFGGLLATQFNTWFLAGEHLSIGKWIPERIGPGRARYATAVQLIDPDRLSNPYMGPELPNRRQGVELAEFGEPVGYHIRDAHPGDWPLAAASVTWSYIPRETAWGRPVGIHGFEVKRAGQVRGKPMAASIVEALRLQDVVERGTAAQSVLNALYATTLETEYGGMDPELVEQIFGKDPQTQAILPPNVDMTFRGVKVPVMPPGVRLSFKQPANPAAAQFAQFEESVLRRVAAGVGLSYEQVSRDYTRTNYSSSRASFAEAWKFMTGRSSFMANSCADIWYAMWLEEAIDTGEVELPKGAPDFYEARADWTACRWIGPGKGYVDESKETQASVMKVDANLSTLEEEAAEQGGDWLEIAEQRAYEHGELKELGLENESAKVYLANTQSITKEDQGRQPAPAGGE
jgi:lambda family phage portal protein